MPFSPVEPQQDASRPIQRRQPGNPRGFRVNAVLCIFKFWAGILGNSAAMVADAVHSLSDFATDIVVLATIHMTRRPVDHDHDWGHGKFETLAS